MDALKANIEIKKIGFVGLGLIGGSIAKTIKRIYPSCEIIATAGHVETITEAYADHTISNSTLLEASDYKDCDYIFLCTPVETNISYLQQMKGILKQDCIITDVGSVKGDIHKAVDELGMNTQFIGGHPMTGSEKTGYKNATAYLLENAYYIITPSDEVSKESIENFTHFIAKLGAIPVQMNASMHDHATAAISHLPHVIASALVNLVHESDDSNETMKMIAAGGFKDITRIASSSPVMWQHICLANQEEILRLMRMFRDKFDEMYQAIDQGNREDIISFFSNSKNYRDSLIIPSSSERVFELYLDLIDEAGGIATVATILANHKISIRNIGIIHNREFEQGVLHIEFYEEKALKDATSCLRESGYTLYER